MSDEVEVRSRLPEVPTAEGFDDLLGRYMWVNEVRLEWASMLTIRGNLKPDTEASTPSALRRSFLDSLDAVMAILEAAGATWESHPDVEIVGQVMHRLGGKWGFAMIECRVRLVLLVPRSA